MLNILKIDTNYDSFKPYITDDSGVLVPYPMGAVFGATDKVKLLFAGDNVPSQTATITFKARYKGIEIAHGEFSYDVAESAYLGQIWWGGDIARGVLAGDESVLTACAFVVEQDGIITEWQFPLNLFASASGIKTDVEMSKKWSDKASEFAHQAGQSAEQAQASAEQAQESAERAEQSAEGVQVFADRAEASAVSSANSAQSALNSAQNAGASATQAEQARDEARAIQASVEAIGSEQISAINAEGTEQVSLINQAGQTNVGNVNQAGTTNIGKVKEMGELWQAKVATAGNSQVANVSDEGSKQVDKVALAGSEWFAKVATEGSEQKAAIEQAGNAQKVAVEQAGTNALAEITTKVGDASEYAHQAGGSADSADTYAQQASEYAFSALEHLAEFCKCKGGYAKLESDNIFTGYNQFPENSLFVGRDSVLTSNSKIPRIGQKKYSLVEATEGSINLWISNNPETTCGVGMSIVSQDGFKMVSANPIGIRSTRGMTMYSSTVELMACGLIKLVSGKIEMNLSRGKIEMNSSDCTAIVKLNCMKIAFLRRGMATLLSRDDEGYLVIDGHRIVTEA